MKSAKLWCLLLMIACCSVVRAQYRGGPGDGAEQLRLSQSNLQGQPMGVQILYFGSQGDGQDRVQAQLYLNGQNKAQLFGGGQGDGHSQLFANLSMEGGNLGQLYFGGPGDGQDVVFSQLTLSGQNLASLYFGGKGDGADQLMQQSFVSGIPTSILFSGGIGDGQDKVLLEGIVGGPSLSMLYDGGNGDGHDVVRYEGIVPFPVVLLSFDAFPEDTYVLLQWVTESEQNSDYFTIEKTTDGNVFLPILNLAAAGYSEEILPYEAVDEDPFNGTSYYRLKAIDIDGAFVYSHLVEVNYSNNVKWSFRMFPNPNAGNELILDIEGVGEDDLQLEVVDMQGRLVLRRKYGKVSNSNWQETIQFSQPLAKGSYLVRLIKDQSEQQAKILLVR
ncbi:MAG: T9SS type A sorting domain-containing protein [Bacteroidota bacterium]